MSKLTQKEYLKKYLSGNKKKRKEHKGTKVKLIDDDFNTVDNLKPTDEELVLCGEDAPQIVEIIDDRSLRMKTIDDFRKSGKWKGFSKTDETNEEEKINKQTDGNTILCNFQEESYKSTKHNEKPDSDLSPVRKRNRYKNHSPSIDLSPQRIKRERRSHDSDSRTSPKRKENERKYKNLDRDPSPQRKTKERRNRSPGEDLSPQRKRKERKYRDRDIDLSPQRIKKESTHQSSNDDSSPKRRGQESKNKSTDSDLSPQRKRTGRRDHNSDRAPSSRRKRSNKDVLPAPKDNSKKFKGQNAYSSDPDLYPQIKSRDRRRSFSPIPNSQQYECRSSPKNNKQYSRKERDFISPSVKRKTSPVETSSRSDKTLDGKTAGLQNAAMLKKELEQSRRKEDELFEKLSKDVTGKHSEVVVREKKHKRPTDYDEEREERKRIEKEQRKKTYSRWGKGMKQTEEYENKLTEDLYESSKPLARYSNDADLDKYLKDQERDGDPMLEYMRSKKREQDSDKPAVPVYKGSYPENRFNIKPGYRWDGVDRSNGYEAKWFTIQNEKIARQEEAYRYSTEDM